MKLGIEKNLWRMEVEKGSGLEGQLNTVGMKLQTILRGWSLQQSHRPLEESMYVQKKEGIRMVDKVY